DSGLALSPVPRQALPGIVEPAGANVVGGLGLTDAPLDLEIRLVDESLLPLLVVERRVGEQAPDDRAPGVEVLEHRLQMLPRAVLGAEVRQEQRVGGPGQDRLPALVPGL